MRKAQRVWSVRSFAVVVLLLNGCDTGPSRAELQALFDEGEFLCREARWDEAREVLRKFLLHNPDHAGAHFYLGRAYLFSTDFRPAIAEGELQTALQRFIDGGRQSPIDRFGPDYFEMICHVEIAKVYLLQIDLFQSMGASPRALQGLYQRAVDSTQRAKAIIPGSKDVADLEEILGLSQPAPSASRTAPSIDRTR